MIGFPTRNTESFVDFSFARRLGLLASIDLPKRPICVHIGTTLVRVRFQTNCTIVREKIQNVMKIIEELIPEINLNT